jgi:hypothetical protein
MKMTLKCRKGHGAVERERGNKGLLKCPISDALPLVEETYSQM